VELKSKAGSIKLPVMLSPGVHPNVVAIAEGCGHEGYGNIEHGERYRGVDPFTYAIWWGHEGHGVNPNRVKPLVSGDEAGPGSLVTKVKIQKA
jgi:anaerobic selenocysteine-containing dehydrogenase